MTNENTPGIYMIVNKETGRAYIGSSSRIGVRMVGHRSALNRGKHANRAFQSDWTLHGAAAFVFLTLEIIAAKAERVRREQYWVDALRPFGALYNSMLTVGAGGARQSAAMDRAIERVASGETVYAAAKAEGVTGTGIRRTDAYRELIAAGKISIGKAGRKPK